MWLGLTRCSGVAIAVLVLASCADGVRSPTHAPRAAEVAAPRLAWASADAEVWSWRVTVRGRSIGDALLHACAIDVGGVRVPASVQAGEFVAELALAPGDNVLVAHCRDARGRALQTPPLRYAEQLVDAPRAYARAVVRDGALLLDARQSVPSTRSRAALADYTWLERFGTGEDRAIGSGPQLEYPVPQRAGDYLYTLQLRDRIGARDAARVLVRVEDGVARVPDAQDAARIDDAVVYGVLPPLFGTPPLAGVRAALDRIADLGVSVLWLAPLFRSPSGDFGYAVTDYRALRSDYGSERDLSALVREAHARGLRVVLDLPANDTSDQHPYFVQAAQLGTRSHYFPFYARDARGAPTHYFDWRNLPNLEYGNAEVDRFMIAASLYWIDAFAIDGYRVDAAWGVRERSPEFWPMWSRELRRVAPAALLLAEAPARDAYYAASGFDLAYDWSDTIGARAWRDVFGNAPGIVTRLNEALADSLEEAEPAARVLHFLNNNDTGARFITRHGVGMTRVATAALLTLPGVPCIYSLDEIGAEYDPYAALPALPLEGDAALRALHRTLIHLRRATPALRGRGFQPVLVDGEREVYAYVRQGGSAAHVALVVLHFSAQPVRASIAIPERYAALRDERLHEALSAGAARARDGTLALELGAWDAKVFVPDATAFVRAEDQFTPRSATR